MIWELEVETNKFVQCLVPHEGKGQASPCQDEQGGYATHTVHSKHLHDKNTRHSIKDTTAYTKGAIGMKK